MMKRILLRLYTTKQQFSSFIKLLKYIVANKSGFDGEGASRQLVTLVSLYLSQLPRLAVRSIKSIQGEGNSNSANRVAKKQKKQLECFKLLSQKKTKKQQITESFKIFGKCFLLL